MNIILTIDFSPWSAYSGGAQNSTHNLAKALCRRGHAVSVVYTKPPWEKIDLPPNLPYAVHWATFFDLWSRRRAPLRPSNALSVARTVRGLLEPGRETVVHSNGEEGGLIYRLRERHRFGFIATPRHPRYPAALLAEGPISPLKKAWLVCTEGKYLMQGSAVRHADLCVPPSAFAADLVRRAFGLNPAQLRVIHNGVPEDFLAYRHDPEAAADGPLVFFGRFEPTKGVDTLVEALALLGPQAPPSLIIGRGPEQQTLDRQIQARGLADRVTILPWMAPPELARTLTGARMAVLPSREENFSLAILSAMAVGVPVISTRTGGTPEIITHAQTGLLAEPDQPRALATHIADLLANPARAIELGQAGRARVHKQFTWDVAAKTFEDLYRTVLLVPTPPQASQPPVAAGNVAV